MNAASLRSIDVLVVILITLAACTQGAAVTILLPPDQSPLQEDTSEQPLPNPLEIEGGFSYESLNNNFDAWRSLYLEISKRFDTRTSLYGTIRQTQRFSLRDHDISLGTYFPLSEDWIGVCEGSLSPSHRVLPQWSFMAQVQHMFDGGMLVHLGLRHVTFTRDTTNTNVNTALFTVERYWAQYRVSYTLYLSHVSAGGVVMGHRIWGSLYYDDDRSAVNLAFSIGKEIENLGPIAGVVSSTVRAVTLFGKHLISKEWACAYEFNLHEQGTFYTRKGLRIGIRYHF